jgi:hypothetical protein
LQVLQLSPKSREFLLPLRILLRPDHICFQIGTGTRELVQQFLPHGREVIVGRDVLTRRAAQ